MERNQHKMGFARVEIGEHSKMWTSSKHKSLWH